MTLLNVSIVVWLLGALGLAAALFLLQRLRVRYRRHTVITTLFWNEALEEARARVLVRRFRHLPAYLLILLIATLMWLGFANPRFDAAEKTQHVVLLDGSAAMAEGSRFTDAVQTVKVALDDLPIDQRRVVLCGARPYPVLQPGEHARLLDERLRDFQPEACSANVEAVVRSLPQPREAHAKLRVLVAGQATISRTLQEELGDGVQLQRIGAWSTKLAPTILSLGSAHAASGQWDRVDVLCEVAGDVAGIKAELGRAAIDEVQRSVTNARTRFLLRDLPANGETLRVEVPGTTVTAAMRLPLRKRVRVRVDASVAPSVTAALRADPAVTLVPDNPDVQVGGKPSTDTPALLFVPMAQSQEAIFLHYRGELTANEVLGKTFDKLGLSQVDAMETAQRSGLTISIGAMPDTHRKVVVWQELLTPQFNFVETRSFPLFIARSVRWLAKAKTEPAFVATGEPVQERDGVHVDTRNRRLDPVGASFRPPRAGEYRNEDGQRVVAAVLNPFTTTDGKDPLPTESSTDTSGSFDVTLWLAALLLALLLLEWFLFRTGRMP